MLRKEKFGIAVMCICAWASVAALACTMKCPSYTLTQLRGKVMGHFFGEHLQALAPNWLRRWWSVQNAELKLYEYRPDAFASGYKGREVATVRTNSKGNFSFPILEKGRYVLTVMAGEHLGAFFLVEIDPAAARTQSVTIDAFPLLSDCTGGDYLLIDSTAKVKN